MSKRERAGSSKKDFLKDANAISREMKERVDVDGVKDLLDELNSCIKGVNDGSMEVDDAEEEVSRIESDFRSLLEEEEPDYEEGDDNKEVEVELEEGEWGTAPPVARPLKHSFHGEAQASFCHRKSLREIIQRVVRGNDVSIKKANERDIEDLLALAIEMRMLQVLTRLAGAARASEDVAEYGTVRQTSHPIGELRRLAVVEQDRHEARLKREREELDALAEVNADDARVKAHMEDKAKAQRVLASSETALSMFRAAVPTTSRTKMAKSAVQSLEPSPDIVILQAKKAEGERLSAEQERLLQEWEKRSSANAAGKRRIEESQARSERKVGLRELMFVMDSDPYFKSVRMLSTLKSGFIGRGIPGEQRTRVRE